MLSAVLADSPAAGFPRDFVAWSPSPSTGHRRLHYEGECGRLLRGTCSTGNVARSLKTNDILRSICVLLLLLLSLLLLLLFVVVTGVVDGGGVGVVIGVVSVSVGAVVVAAVGTVAVAVCCVFEGREIFMYCCYWTLVRLLALCCAVRDMCVRTRVCLPVRLTARLLNKTPYRRPLSGALFCLE